MERDQLEQLLSAGRSQREIGELYGLAESTVGYWLKRHGLEAAHRERVAARGGLARESLEPLVEAGLTVRQIAATVDRSYTTVRYWLRRHGLRTQHRSPGRSRGGEDPVRECRRHGEVAYVRNSADGQLRCPKCRSADVSARRRRVKETLVAEAGGCCALCGYDRYQGALHFHHLDPASKTFALSLSGLTLALDKLRAEAAKCVLLCGNCHAEIEAGVAVLPR